MTARGRWALAGAGIVAAAAFIAVATVVTRDPTAIPPLDQAWHDALRRFGVDHSTWLSTMRLVTYLGATVTVVAVDVALCAICLRQGRRRLAAFVAVVGVGGWALRILLRDLFDRPRPADPLWTADAASFPSGHTTNATLMVALVVAVAWPLVGTAARVAISVGAIAGALAVGLSRIAGGVHWPTDVLGGWTLAVAYLCLIAAIFPWGRAAAR